MTTMKTTMTILTMSQDLAALPQLKCCVLEMMLGHLLVTYQGLCRDSEVLTWEIDCWWQVQTVLIRLLCNVSIIRWMGWIRPQFSVGIQCQHHPVGKGWRIESRKRIPWNQYSCCLNCQICQIEAVKLFSNRALLTMRPKPWIFNS